MFKVTLTMRAWVFFFWLLLLCHAGCVGFCILAPSKQLPMYYLVDHVATQETVQVVPHTDTYWPPTRSWLRMWEQYFLHGPTICKCVLCPTGKTLSRYRVQLGSRPNGSVYYAAAVVSVTSKDEPRGGSCCLKENNVCENCDFSTHTQTHTHNFGSKKKTNDPKSDSFGFGIWEKERFWSIFFGTFFGR